MPNVEALQEWVADLRSGRFKQGRNVLRHGDEYCCMGVACETHMRLTCGLGEGWSVVDDEGNYEYAREDQVLPDLVMEWLGVGSTDPELETGDEFSPHESCSTLNDIREWNFARIADALERTYLAEPAS